MPEQPLTLKLPDPLFRLLQERAARSNREIEAEALEVLASGAASPGDLPPDLAAAIDPLPLLTDVELWRAAGNPLPAELAQEMERLHGKRQREGLTDVEERTLAQVVRQYERTMLVRAQAAALLHQRGQDVSALLNQP